VDDPKLRAYILEHANVDASLARNPGAPAEILEGLGEPEPSWIRGNPAGDPRTPVGLLEELYQESPPDSVTPVSEGLMRNEDAITF
jgi:hypothetical protein